ncbi:hypothetical protein I316_05190 [Kwoniella heveanensis BCC8398]|uniref:Uncharacterized protein n=1 Tax=Kwoniella heveanensis BCC8398 TaxID=1296120 RepID=A0A1B9GQM4_9TREE|nr:hypothetical protein I316_05190 [Kwoniella heveanensis BCC8398]
MGKWSQKQYDDVLVTKVMKLFEHVIESDGMNFVKDKRFRTFVRKLDPDNRNTQRVFRSLIVQGVCAPGEQGRPASASTSLGPSGLPLPVPSEAMRIIYGGPPAARDRTAEHRERTLEAIRERQQMAMERAWETSVLHNRSPTPIPTRNVHDNTYDYNSHSETVSGHRRNDTLDFDWPGPSTRSLLSDSSPPPPSLSYARAQTQSRNQNQNPDQPRLSMNLHRSSGTSGTSTRGGRHSPGSPPNAASLAWLEEYGAAASTAGAAPDNGVAERLATFRTLTDNHPRIARSMPQRVRRSQAPFGVHIRSDSEQSEQIEAPDDFDNLLDQPPSSVIRPARRRRREETEDDSDTDRPAVRRRYHQSPTLSEGETSWQNNHPWLAGLPMARSAGRQGQDGRDTRRDGIVFDNSIMAQLTGNDLTGVESGSDFGDEAPFFDFEPDLLVDGEEIERLQANRPIIASNGDTSVDGTTQVDVADSP